MTNRTLPNPLDSPIPLKENKDAIGKCFAFGLVPILSTRDGIETGFQRSGSTNV